MVKLNINGADVTINNLNIYCNDKKLGEALDLMLDLYLEEMINYAPDRDYVLALMVVKDFGGEIVSYKAKKYIENPEIIF